MKGICLEIKTNCGSCGNPLPLNALVNKFLCSGCQHTAEFSYEFWKNSILGVKEMTADLKDMEENEGRNSTVMTGQYTFQKLYANQKPRCGKCKTQLDSGKYEDYSAAGFALCKNCGSEVSVRHLSGEAGDILFNISYLIGEDRDLLGDVPAPLSTTKNLSKPILFTCPSCAGNLEVDGSERVIKCKFCNSEIYLPDDLWHRMHPVKVVGRWYIVVDETKPGTKPKSADAFQGWETVSDAAIDKNGNVYVVNKIQDSDDESEDDHDDIEEKDNPLNPPLLRGNFVGKTMVWSFTADKKTRWLRSDLNINHADALIAESDGILFVSDKRKPSMLKLSAETGSTMGDINGELNLKDYDDWSPDTDGTFIVLRDNKVERYSKDGGKLSVWEDTGGLLKDLFGGSEATGPLGKNFMADVAELTDKPLQIFSGFAKVCCGQDGNIYFMGTGTEPGIAKFSRDGEKLWYTKIPYSDVKGKHYADKDGNVYLLFESHDKLHIAHLLPDGNKWGNIIDTKMESWTARLALSESGKIYCFGVDGLMKVFDGH